MVDVKPVGENGRRIWASPEVGEKNFTAMGVESQLKIVNAAGYELPIQIPRK